MFTNPWSLHHSSTPISEDTTGVAPRSISTRINAVASKDKINNVRSHESAPADKQKMPILTSDALIDRPYYVLSLSDDSHIQKLTINQAAKDGLEHICKDFSFKPLKSECGYVVFATALLFLLKEDPSLKDKFMLILESLIELGSGLSPEENDTRLLQRSAALVKHSLNEDSIDYSIFVLMLQVYASQITMQSVNHGFRTNAGTAEILALQNLFIDFPIGYLDAQKVSMPNEFFKVKFCLVSVKKGCYILAIRQGATQASIAHMPLSTETGHRQTPLPQAIRRNPLPWQTDPRYQTNLPAYLNSLMHKDAGADITFLAKEHVDVNINTPDGKPFIHQAIVHKKYKAFEAFLRAAAITKIGELFLGDTILHTIVQKDDMQAYEILQKDPAKLAALLNIRNRHDETPLCVAAKNINERFVKKLLANNPELSVLKGCAPLHYIVVSMPRLFANFITIAQNKSDGTLEKIMAYENSYVDPLIFKTRDKLILETLMLEGIDLCRLEKGSNRTLLYNFAKDNNIHLADVFCQQLQQRYPDKREQVLNQKVTVELWNGENREKTALIRAVEKGHEKIVSLLIRENVDYTSRVDGRRPIDCTRILDIGIRSLLKQKPRRSSAIPNSSQLVNRASTAIVEISEVTPITAITPISWQEELQTSLEDDAQYVKDIAEKVISAMKDRQLEPIDDEEVAAIKFYIEIAGRIHHTLAFPIEAVALGFLDNFSNISSQHLRLAQQNQQDAIRAAIPYCYKYLPPLDEWENLVTKDLTSNQIEMVEPLKKVEMVELLKKEMNKNPQPLFPFNTKEVKALNTLACIASKLGDSQEHIYTSHEIARGCTAYLAKMRIHNQSFDEIFAFGDVIPKISSLDLYPYCFEALIESLLQDHPQKEAIVAFFKRHAPIKGKKVPINTAGKERLRSLLHQIGEPAFANGQGISHHAMAGKLPSILFDLDLSSVEQFNRSQLPPERVALLFECIQKERFSLPNVFDLIDLIRNHPEIVAKSLIDPIISTLLPNINETDVVKVNLNNLIDQLKISGLDKFVETQLHQLKKSPIELTKSIDASISISTQGILDVLLNELEAFNGNPKDNTAIAALFGNTSATSGVLGPVIKDSVEAIMQLQNQRSNENEAALQQLAKVLTHLVGNGIGKRCMRAVAANLPTDTVKPLVNKLAQLILNYFILPNTEVKIEQAQHPEVIRGRKILTGISDNREKLVSILLPLAQAFLQHHKLKQHKDLIIFISNICQDPTKRFTDEDKNQLAFHFAQSASILLKEIKAQYPHLIEDMLELLINRANKGQAPQAPSIILSPPVEDFTATVSQHYLAFKGRFEEKLRQAYPLEGEIDGQANADGLWAFVNKTAQNLRSAFTDFEAHKRVRTFAQELLDELSKHPFLMHADEAQLDVLMQLAKEGASAAYSAFPVGVIPKACRIYFEEYLPAQPGQLPTVLQLGSPSLQERLAQHYLQAMVEFKVQSSQHPHKQSRYFTQTILALFRRVIAPSKLSLNLTGLYNIAALTEIILERDFAQGKPLDLPLVSKQFKYMYPRQFNTIEALNQQTITDKMLLELKLTSQRLVERRINLGLLQNGFTQSPEQAVALLCAPLIDALVPDLEKAFEAKNELAAFLKELATMKQLTPLKEGVYAYLNKLGLLKSIQADVSISTRSATMLLYRECEQVSDFMCKNNRIPSEDEAKAMGVVAFQFVSVVKTLSFIKDIQNGRHVNSLKEKDFRRQLLEALPRVNESLERAKPLLGYADRIPSLLTFLEGRIPSILKLVVEYYVASLEGKRPFTLEDTHTLEFLNLLLKEDNLIKLAKFALPIVNSILTRHKLEHSLNLIDQLIEISSPNKSRVNEVKLMGALLDTVKVSLNEINTHYEDVIPDLINAIKTIALLGVDHASEHAIKTAPSFVAAAQPAVSATSDFPKHRASPKGLGFVGYVNQPPRFTLQDDASLGIGLLAKEFDLINVGGEGDCGYLVLGMAIMYMAKKDSILKGKIKDKIQDKIKNFEVKKMILGFLAIDCTVQQIVELVANLSAKHSLRKSFVNFWRSLAHDQLRTGLEKEDYTLQSLCMSEADIEDILTTRPAGDPELSALKALFEVEIAIFYAANEGQKIAQNPKITKVDQAKNPPGGKGDCCVLYISNGIQGHYDLAIRKPMIKA